MTPRLTLVLSGAPALAAEDCYAVAPTTQLVAAIAVSTGPMPAASAVIPCEA